MHELLHRCQQSDITLLWQFQSASSFCMPPLKRFMGMFTAVIIDLLVRASCTILWHRMSMPYNCSIMMRLNIIFLSVNSSTRLIIYVLIKVPKLLYVWRDCLLKSVK
jgi:hypothetical protein